MGVRWPWRRPASTSTTYKAIATPRDIPLPPMVPADLVGWFPIARVCVIGGNVYTLAIASCSRCGAAVAIYDRGDDAHLRRHVEWHRTDREA